MRSRRPAARCWVRSAVLAGLPRPGRWLARAARSGSPALSAATTSGSSSTVWACTRCRSAWARTGSCADRAARPQRAGPPQEPTRCSASRVVVGVGGSPARPVAAAGTTSRAGRPARRPGRWRSATRPGARRRGPRAGALRGVPVEPLGQLALGPRRLGPLGGQRARRARGRWRSGAPRVLADRVALRPQRLGPLAQWASRPMRGSAAPRRRAGRGEVVRRGVCASRPSSASSTCETSAGPRRRHLGLSHLELAPAGRHRPVSRGRGRPRRHGDAPGRPVRGGARTRRPGTGRRRPGRGELGRHAVEGAGAGRASSLRALEGSRGCRSVGVPAARWPARRRGRARRASSRPVARRAVACARRRPEPGPAPARRGAPSTDGPAQPASTSALGAAARSATAARQPAALRRRPGAGRPGRLAERALRRPASRASAGRPSEDGPGGIAASVSARRGLRGLLPRPGRGDGRCVAAWSGGRVGRAGAVGRRARPPARRCRRRRSASASSSAAAGATDARVARRAAPCWRPSARRRPASRAASRVGLAASARVPMRPSCVAAVLARPGRPGGRRPPRRSACRPTVVPAASPPGSPARRRPARPRPGRARRRAPTALGRSAPAGAAAGRRSHSSTSVNRGDVEEPLEHLAAVLGRGPQERGEVALRQQHDLGELLPSPCRATSLTTSPTSSCGCAAAPTPTERAPRA